MAEQRPLTDEEVRAALPEWAQRRWDDIHNLLTRHVPEQPWMQREIVYSRALAEALVEVEQLKAEVAEACNDLKQASDGFDVLSQQYLTRAEQTEAEVERLRKVIPLARRLLKWTGPPWFDKQPPLNHLIRDLQDAINEADDAAHEATEGKR